MATTGPATAVIEGLALGMGSVALPMMIIALGTLAAYGFGGLYGIALAAVGMMYTTAITLTVDAYGPIADNAGGIAEMAGLAPEIRQRTDLLDALGNTTAAVGKGIAIGSAALTALALFAAYAERAHLQVVDLLHPEVTAGLVVGGSLPFLFSAFSLRAVGKAAQEMVGEVRRQFRTKKLLSGIDRPDYARCVDISTRTALREMLLPGSLAVLLPLLVGLTLGRDALGGMLAGSLASGVALAIQMANSGGAMDNAKKLIESGQYGGRGTPAHAAAVVADTVGDPLKDTAGPSLNILLKLMSIVALVFVPLFR
jgi:K(+)-stimulated pyrophosphate-energized sodium pump